MCKEYEHSRCQYQAEEDLGNGENLDDRLRTAYGCLVYGKAVCEGYAAAMTLEGLGVENATVRVVDKGALDCTIRARVTAAAVRASGKDVWKD